MRLNPRDKIELSNLRFERAAEFLADARANAEEKRYKTAVNRAYYAALHAVRSLLILEGVDPESHSGAITTLSLHFIKTGLLPVEVVKDIKILLSRRTDVDYGDFETVDADEAADSVLKAEGLLGALDTLRKKMSADLEKLSG